MCACVYWPFVINKNNGVNCGLVLMCNIILSLIDMIIDINNIFKASLQYCFHDNPLFCSVINKSVRGNRVYIVSRII